MKSVPRRRPWVPALFVVALATLVAVPTAAEVPGQTSMHPYRPAPTRACLARHGMRLLRPQVSTDTIEWHIARDISGLPSSDILLSFSMNPARAALYEQQLKTVAHKAGLTDKQVQHYVIRRGNVVIEPNYYPHALTPAREATIVHCLR